ncbi:MAG: acetoacetate metabolism regulatory protein AtoC [Candidatus Binatia bacterium]|nr:MAG: acetoacetate metabolism regulatory protein AtoC [Candidatus Binatia bacterium]
MGKGAILIVDDDPLIRRQLQHICQQQGYRADVADGVGSAVALLERYPYDLLLLDLMMPGRDGASLLQEVRQRWQQVDVIMVTAHGSIRGAVEAMRAGATDYVTKPFSPDELVLAIDRVFERRRLLNEIEVLRDQLAQRYRFGNMVSRNPRMREIFRLVASLANADVTVLISGESGTGKELVARALHEQGKRRSGPFVPINCAAIPENLLESELFGYERGAFTGATGPKEGKIEAAHGGTLFLDEVESIPLAMQGKLLRVLEERCIERLGSTQRTQIDMRVVAATNQDLAECVSAGKMRPDFYYRIAVVPIELPPLRERREDIPLLATEFLARHPLAREKNIESISEQAMDVLMNYDWPGNVRELWNVLERAIVTADGHCLARVDVGTSRLREPGELAVGSCSRPLREFVREAERWYLNQLLERFRGNVTQAARHAGIDQATFHRKMRDLGIRAAAFRRA